MTGFGNRPPGYRADAPDDVRAQVEGRAPLSDRVLACLATWVHDDGEVIEPTTGDLAARLDLAPESYQRDELNQALTGLRQRGLVKYEHDRELDGQLRWRLSHGGWSLARRLDTGTTGFARRDGTTRPDDRFAKVRGASATPPAD